MDFEQLEYDLTHIEAGENDVIVIKVKKPGDKDGLSAFLQSLREYYQELIDNKKVKAQVLFMICDDLEEMNAFSVRVDEMNAMGWYRAEQLGVRNAKEKEVSDRGL